jgi:hypothetical protein
MASYRFYYVINGSLVRSGEYLEADDDDEAIALLRLRAEEVDIELWCGPRRIALIADGEVLTQWLDERAASAAPPSLNAPPTASRRVRPRQSWRQA